MKKLLIIQKDKSYFLFETIRVLEKCNQAFKDYHLTILVNEQALAEAFKLNHPIVKGITFDEKEVMTQHFDASINLSLDEDSWSLHGLISSDKKTGPYKFNNQTVVGDLWSTYLLTLKAQAPFLTFHLQDIYKNILGVRGGHNTTKTFKPVTQIAYGASATHLFSADEQEHFITELSRNYPNIPIIDISEIDMFSDLTSTLYIGPAGLDALRFCEAGGRGVFLSSSFQGFNLMPYTQGHLLLSSKGKSFKSAALLKILGNILRGKSGDNLEYAAYSIDQENVFGSFLRSLNQSDDNYPFYQTHVVLWNFLLNLYEVDLDISNCANSQVNFLKSNLEVLNKYIRLHSYAMVSVDKIFHEAKSSSSNGKIIDGHIQNLSEIDLLSDKISSSHTMLRPILDFYRIRRGQNSGTTLLEQVQNSFFVYSEEHQALEALRELFSVTLKRNEVNI